MNSFIAYFFLIGFSGGAALLLALVLNGKDADLRHTNQWLEGTCLLQKYGSPLRFSHATVGGVYGISESGSLHWIRSSQVFTTACSRA
jgi:hypothetical protein|nr:hypothetical protein [Neorhizobium tomejilense]